jgi:hypothetical protein
VERRPATMTDENDHDQAGLPVPVLEPIDRVCRKFEAAWKEGSRLGKRRRGTGLSNSKFYKTRTRILLSKKCRLCWRTIEVSCGY